MDVIKSILALWRDSFLSIGSLIAITISLTIVAYTWHWFGKKRGRELDRIQEMLDALLSKAEESLGKNVRVTLMTRDGDKVRPLIVRPRNTKLSADSPPSIEVTEAGRIAIQKQIAWYATLPVETLSKERAAATKEVQAYIAVPIIDKDGAVTGVITLESSVPFSPESDDMKHFVEYMERIGREGGSFLLA